MKSTNHNKISDELVKAFNKEETFELAYRFEDVNYASSFNGPNDLNLLRTLAINKTELSSDYFHRLH